MPEWRSGSPACPDKDRQRRLAARLADTVPGATTIHVSLTDPRATWPHPYAVARHAAGRRVELSRTASTTVARWIQRAWPDADWAHAHILDLTTATLGVCDATAAAGGR